MQRSCGSIGIIMDAAEFAARYIDAWNSQDAQAIASHISDQGKYLDITVHQEMSREELLVHLEEIFRLEPYVYELVGEVCAGPNTVAFQYRAVLRDAEDDEGTYYGAEFITMNADTATDIVDYYQQRGVTSPQSPIADVAGPSNVQRYAKSGLSIQQMDDVKKALAALMEEQQVYLQPDITLPELAETLECSVNHLSQVINAGFGMSFFDYLNQYRVRDAMKLLEPCENEAPTVLAVALEVGFNSTSTFYVAFKKVTGQTPAQYRRSLNG
ncbi:MAG: helix-turn-helix domain-containing protein [Halieaceae bacterium]|nr:helix-turn-helix domain-containing protein [Halieaceae bacterium]